MIGLSRVWHWYDFPVRPTSFSSGPLRPRVSLMNGWPERATFEQPAHRQFCAIGTAKSCRPLSPE